MPLLGVSHSVDLGDLFVDVNILEALNSDRRLELDDLWQDFTDGVKNYSSYRSFDRIALGNPQQRVSGLEVVDKNSNLMVLGKPGSGKTTYLQRIVTECNQGNLQPHRVPVLIKMREFVDDGCEFEYNLKPYLTQQWRLDKTETELILNHGKALILLDGLDEVSGTDGREISKKIQQFARNYPQNQLIVTCRTNRIEDHFNWKSLRFDFIEVADFDKQQINVFVEHYFNTVNPNKQERHKKAKEFLENFYLEENKNIRELAITPILLNLTCAVFHQRGKFHSKRSTLYEEGLELLLKKWDDSKGIERDEIYKVLLPEQKQELLSYLAVKKFEQDKYVLFEQEEIEGYIADFLHITRRDSGVVLKAIEAQHGLLIKRAQKVWSFSHLTFQEYFVAKWFCQKKDFKRLVIHINKKYWREIFLMLCETCHNVTDFLNLIKENSDKILTNDSILQQFLLQISLKYPRSPVPYNPLILRSFYLTLLFDPDNRELSEALGVHIDFQWDSGEDSIIDDFIREFNIERLLNLALGNTLANTIIGSSYITFYTIIKNVYELICELELLDWSQLKDSMVKILDNINPIIKTCTSHTPGSNTPEDKWWTSNRINFSVTLRNIMYRNNIITHGWQFNDEQQEKLEKYHYASSLLVHCLKSANVTSEFKKEIEEAMLVPINEIEKCKLEIIWNNLQVSKTQSRKSKYPDFPVSLLLTSDS
jgi:hypothetical protein